jgi:hypothetical protein
VKRGAVIATDPRTLDAGAAGARISSPGLISRRGCRGSGAVMTDEVLTGELASRVMGWKTAPDRFVKGGRSWIPRWRFQPLVELADAFRLLDKGARRYSLTCDGRRTFSVEVQVGTRHGKASSKNKARAITLAVARALGLEVGE